MKINTKAALKDLSGKEIKDGDSIFTIGKAIAKILISAKDGGKMKMFVLGQEFYQEDSVDLDAADLSLVKTAVEKSEGFSNLITGQVLVLLSENKK